MKWKESDQNVDVILSVNKVEGDKLLFEYKGEVISVSVSEETALIVQAALEDEVISLMINTETKQLKENPFEGFASEVSMFEGDEEIAL